VERTSSRAGLTPAVDHHLFTAHRFRDLSALTSSERFTRTEFFAIARTRELRRWEETLFSHIPQPSQRDSSVCA
jgi:hypothetical protein